MHVLLLNQYYAPSEAATAQLLTDLGEQLVAAGHRVTVVCSRRSYPDPSLVYPASERIAGVTVRRVWTSGFGRGSKLGRMSDYLGFIAGAGWRLLLERDVDVVVSLTTPPFVASVGLAAARLRGARSIAWVMDVYPELAFRLGVLGRRSPLGRLLSIVERGTLARSDLCIALGETMAERVRESGARKVAVVHNWADGEAIRPQPVAGNPLREQWGWSDRFVVLYSGNLGLAHDFGTVLDAADRLRDESRVLFAFVGEGPRRADVEAEVRRRALPNVEFRPHVARERLGDSLTAGELHLVTMREGIEGLVVPSKIYGILAAGRPTLFVGPAEGEMPDILAAAGCGERIAVGDAGGLAQAVRRYAGDPQRCADQGRAAREAFDARFDRRLALAAHRRWIEALADDDG